MFISAGDSPLAPGNVGAPDASGAGQRGSLLELVLSLAQVQYEMESRSRGGLSTDELRRSRIR